MLQRVSHFRGRAISTSCLPNTLTFYALTLNMKFFVALFSTTIYSRILKLYRKLPHIILQRVSHFRGRAISTSCLPNTLTFYALTLYMKFFVALFSATIYSRILKLYRKLPHIMLQRVSHFRGRAISTSCLPNTLTFQALTLNMNFFRHTFLNNYIQQDLETLQEASTHHTVACKPFSWSCHIHFLFAEYFKTFYTLTLYMTFFVALFSATIYSRILKLYRKLPHIMLQRVSHFRGRAISTSCLPNTLTFQALTLNMKFFVALFSTTIYSRILKLYRKLPHIILQRVSHFRGSCHIHFLFAEYFNILHIDIVYDIFSSHFSQQLQTVGS